MFLGSKYAAIQMIAQGHGGRIINLSSIHAKIAEPQASPYTAAKSGIESFTRTIATELTPYKITANITASGEYYLMCLPLKLIGTDGANARAVLLQKVFICSIKILVKAE